MSAQTKTRVQKIGKILGIALFAFLMFFNIKFALSDNANGDIDLFGLKVSVFTSSTYASSFSCKVTLNCGNGTIECSGTSSCSRGPNWVTCDGITVYC